MVCICEVYCRAIRFMCFMKACKQTNKRTHTHTHTHTQFIDQYLDSLASKSKQNAFRERGKKSSRNSMASLPSVGTHVGAVCVCV
jgi:hypothetical protein